MNIQKIVNAKEFQDLLNVHGADAMINAIEDFDPVLSEPLQDIIDNVLNRDPEIPIPMGIIDGLWDYLNEVKQNI